jgi:hypothetical protein
MTFSEHGLHAEVMLLQSVYERNGKLLVHILRQIDKRLGSFSKVPNHRFPNQSF